jgi:hypothetical protein
MQYTPSSNYLSCGFVRVMHRSQKISTTNIMEVSMRVVEIFDVGVRILLTITMPGDGMSLGVFSQGIIW